MKKWWIISIVFGFLQTGFAQLPDIQLKNLGGQSVSIQENLGEQLTVIDFWATWCKPCVTAIPKISKLADEFLDQGVAFWGINIDSPRNQAKVKPFVKSLNISYPVFLDSDQELMTDLNVRAMPTLLILNAKGKIQYFHEGFQLGDEETIRNEIKKLLAKSE